MEPGLMTLTPEIIKASDLIHELRGMFGDVKLREVNDNCVEIANIVNGLIFKNAINCNMHTEIQQNYREITYVFREVAGRMIGSGKRPPTVASDEETPFVEGMKELVDGTD